MLLGSGSALHPPRTVAGRAKGQLHRLLGTDKHIRVAPHIAGDKHRLTDASIFRGQGGVPGGESAGSTFPVDTKGLCMSIHFMLLDFSHIMRNVVDKLQSGVAVAYRAGARMIYQDSIQYHPTGVVWPEQMLGLLISEHLRAKGAQVVDNFGEQLANQVETRDVLSSAIIRGCTAQGRGVPTPSGRQGIWLDTPLIDVLNGKGTIKRQFSGIYHRFSKFGIDVTQEPILIYAAQHYQNGGLTIDGWSESTVPNLYAVGEVAGGVHGKNRLGSNSIGDILVFGLRAGRHAAETMGSEWPETTLDHVRAYETELSALTLPERAPAPLLFPDYGPPDPVEAVR